MLQLWIIEQCLSRFFSAIVYFQAPTFSYDLSTSTCISKTPLVPDPYEDLFVFVDESLIPMAGEGLFAKADLEAATVIAFYNGIRLTSKESPPMEDSGYKLKLDKDHDLDLPPGMESLDHYCASLGHKV